MSYSEEIVTNSDLPDWAIVFVTHSIQLDMFTDSNDGLRPCPD